MCFSGGLALAPLDRLQEMELIMPTTYHVNGYKSAGSNGNNKNRFSCATAGQCMEPY